MSIRNIIHNSIQKSGPLNILTFFYNGVFDIELLKTGHHFYGVQEMSSYAWPGYNNKEYPNLHILKSLEEIRDIPLDLIILNHRERQHQLFNIPQQLHVPAIIIDHDFSLNNPFFIKKLIEQTPYPSYSTSEIVAKQWKNECINYGISENVGQYEKDIDILLCGSFSDGDLFIIDKLKKEFPNIKIYGHNKEGISKTVELFDEYKDLFKHSKVWLNLPQQFGLSYEVLWALKYKTAIVGLALPCYQNILENGKNSILVNNIDDITRTMKNFMYDKKTYQSIVAHETNLSQFSESNFVSRWDEVLNQHAGIFRK